MATRQLFRGRLAAGLVVLLSAGIGAAVAADKGARTPTVEFRDLSTEEGENLSLTISVTLDGSDEKVDVTANATDEPSAPALAEFFNRLIEKGGGGAWKCSADGSRLTIEGWTDPKSGKFYPVKSIRCTSPNIPKGSMPVVKMPPKA